MKTVNNLTAILSKYGKILVLNDMLEETPMALPDFNDFLSQSTLQQSNERLSLTQYYQAYLLWLISQNHKKAPASELLTQLGLINNWVINTLKAKPSVSANPPVQPRSTSSPTDFKKVLFISSWILISALVGMILTLPLGELPHIVAGIFGGAFVGGIIATVKILKGEFVQHTPLADDQAESLLSSHDIQPSPDNELQQLVDYTTAPMITTPLYPSLPANKSAPDQQEVDLENLSDKLRVG